MTASTPEHTDRQESWTVLKLLAWTTGYLRDKGIENARREAEWLLCEASGLDRMGLYLNYDKPLQNEELAVLRTLVTRRGRREPLQHLLGSQEFDGLEFTVAAAALIPRHDTEVLVAEAVRRMPQPRTILEIGTGSGCVAIALAKRLPQAVITAVDLSADALSVARRNAELHGVSIELLHGSYFEPIGQRRFDLIVSNPPYIPTPDLESLQPEVRDYEPRLALDGGPDGLTAYRILAAQAGGYLASPGCLVVEVGIGQASQVTELFQAAGFGAIVQIPDQAGIQRVVGGIWHEAR